jgi:hypothetical protein
MTLFSGRTIDILNPDPKDILIADIAWGLSNEVRFAGQAKCAYTVAHHSLLCCSMAREWGDKYALEALLHDAHEAYLKDLHTPLRNAMKLMALPYSPYEKIVENFDRTIREKFLLPPEMSPKIQGIDQAALLVEYNSLMPPTKEFPRTDLPRLPPAQDQETTRKTFLDTFYQLTCS